MVRWGELTRELFDLQCNRAEAEGHDHICVGITNAVVTIDQVTWVIPYVSVTFRRVQENWVFDHMGTWNPYWGRDGAHYPE